MSRTLASSIHDNHHYNKVGTFLKETIKTNSDCRIVSAYFSIFAFDLLKQQLTTINRLQFLFGEPSFIKPLDLDTEQAKNFSIIEEDLWLENRLQQRAIAKACAEWIKQQKIEIRSLIKTNLLHGKLYHINNNGVELALLGSSNFTLHGLGEANSNIELNLIVDSHRDTQDLKNWFNEIWKDKTLVKDVKKEVLQYLNQLYRNYSPQFIYHKTLYHIFYEDWQRYQQQYKDIEQSGLNDSVIWNTLFDFQKEGVTHAITKIKAHNGCILADSVGLGKTYQALAVIKYFEAKNHSVLVLCPKKLSENWLVYSERYSRKRNPLKADKLNYSVLSHTDLSRDKGDANGINLKQFNWSCFDLIVIDESHNFRNASKAKNGKSRYQRLLEDVIQAGGKTKVLLLSATPVNNDLSDLHNQLRFISADNHHAFADIGIKDTKKTLKAAQNGFHEAVKNNHQQPLAHYLNADFFKLLDAITIARSRKHIERHYPAIAQELGGFPKRNPPQSIYYAIDTQQQFPSFTEIEQEITNYQLALFNPSKYLLDEYRDLAQYQSKVKNFSQANREHYLIGMMKMNFLKRLESSVVSFADTMKRTVIKIDGLINKINHFEDIDSFSDNDINEDEELNDALAVGKKIKFQLKHLDCEQWLQDLNADKDKLIKLRQLAQAVSLQRDGKLKKLTQLIHDKLNNPSIDKRNKTIRKVIVFTAFADTAQYLYQALKPQLIQLNIHCALVTGSHCETTLGEANFNEVLLNFSPVSKNRASFTNSLSEEIEVLIATDCIAEGQNLQDCDWVINYDIHWNPVRLIQRFGRIDRINSQNKSVSLFNFWATAELDQYLNLKNRVEARMALVDISATGSDNLLSEDSANNELNYRDEQLTRMKAEIIDLEDFNNNASLTEFNFDDFRADLTGFLDTQRQQLHDAPLGLYGIVPQNPELNIHKGIIFCLKQKVYQQEAGQQINPLTPFFLCYIQDNGQINYNFTQAKQSLEIFKSLCFDKDQPYEALCQLFDEKTDDGTNMKDYYNLVDKTVAAIKEAFEEKELIKLSTGRGGLLATLSQQITKPTDFTLVTWLIIE